MEFVYIGAFGYSYLFYDSAAWGFFLSGRYQIYFGKIMRLSILIVNWNTRDLMIHCVNSILRYAPPFPHEVIVVDNNSSDGSADTLINLYNHNKNIRVIESIRNLGFAKGNNLAYKNSAGEYIFLLNPDAEVTEGALEALVNFMDAYPDVGIVGPKLLNPDGSLQPSVRRFPTLRSAIAVFSGLHRFLKLDKYLMSKFDYTKQGEVDQVMGAALLTRRKITETLGFLDEKFWLWYEEVDFCKRVKDHGHKVMYFPGAAVIHHKGAGFSQMPVYLRKKTVAQSLIYYFKKNGHFWDVWIISIALPAILFAARFFDFLGLKIKPK